MAKYVSLACPNCHLELQQKDNSLLCFHCDVKWQIRNGIPDFLDENIFYGPISRTELKEINQKISKRDWKDILLNHPSKQVKKAAFSMINPDRANWRLFLPLTRESVVLEVGARSGAVSHIMALSYGHVFAIEPVWEYAEFMSHRFKQEKISNITVIRSNAHQIPVPYHTIDLAVFNDDIMSSGREISQILKKRFLKIFAQIHRCISTGGFICLLVRNRWTPQNIVDRNNDTLSAKGYKNVLEKSGFFNIETFGILPESSNPKFIVPVQDNTFSYLDECFDLQQRTFVSRFKRRIFHVLCIDKYVVPSLCIFGQKLS